LGLLGAHATSMKPSMQEQIMERGWWEQRISSKVPSNVGSLLWSTHKTESFSFNLYFSKQQHRFTQRIEMCKSCCEIENNLLLKIFCCFPLLAFDHLFILVFVFQEVYNLLSNWFCGDLS